MIRIKKVEGGTLPVQKTLGAACYDCYARLPENTFIEIPSNSRCLINLGFCLEMPYYYEAHVRPRSGLSLHGIDVCFGTIDSDYRGEVKACVVNNQPDKFCVKNGDRICQIAFRLLPDIAIQTVDNLSETERGKNGFGSTGV